MYNANGFVYNKQIQNRKKLIVDLHLPNSGRQEFCIELGNTLQFTFGTPLYRVLYKFDSPISDRKKFEFDISGVCGYIQIYAHSNAYAGYGLEYSGNIGAEYMYMFLEKIGKNFQNSLKQKS